MSENQESGKKRRGCGFGCMLLIGLFVGLGIVVAVLLAGSLGLLNLPQQGWHLGNLIHHGKVEADVGEDEAPYMVETWSAGNGDAKVIRIPISGLIMLGNDSWYTGNANTALRSIRRATHDPEVEGLILEVNSGGGGITDSDIIYKAVLDFKAAQKGRVVVTIMGDVAASGAYYIALASDCILAHPTTLTGSIGVIMQSYNIKELAAKIGIKDETFKSGENKDLLNPFHDVSPEQRAMLQAVIDALHSRFVKLVSEARKISEADVRKLADGRIFVADEALARKLIDGIGYSADAEKEMTRLLDAEEINVIRYSEDVSFLDLLRSRRGIGMSMSDFLKPRETRLMYRWWL